MCQNMATGTRSHGQWEAYEFECPDGTWFDAEMKVCNHMKILSLRGGCSDTG